LSPDIIYRIKWRGTPLQYTCRIIVDLLATVQIYSSMHISLDFFSAALHGLLLSPLRTAKRDVANRTAGALYPDGTANEATAPATHPSRISWTLNAVVRWRWQSDLVISQVQHFRPENGLNCGQLDVLYYISIKNFWLFKIILYVTIIIIIKKLSTIVTWRNKIYIYYITYNRTTILLYRVIHQIKHVHWFKNYWKFLFYNIFSIKKKHVSKNVGIYFFYTSVYSITFFFNDKLHAFLLSYSKAEYFLEYFDV